MSDSNAACLKSERIDTVAVSTSSVDYSEFAKKYGADASFIRLGDISTDQSTDYEFVKYYLDCCEEVDEDKPDYVHNKTIYPPRLIENDHIDAAIVKFENSPDATSFRLAEKMSESVYACFEFQNDYLECLCGDSKNI